MLRRERGVDHGRTRRQRQIAGSCPAPGRGGMLRRPDRPQPQRSRRGFEDLPAAVTPVHPGDAVAGRAPRRGRRRSRCRGSAARPAAGDVGQRVLAGRRPGGGNVGGRGSCASGGVPAAVEPASRRSSRPVAGDHPQVESRAVGDPFAGGRPPRDARPPCAAVIDQRGVPSGSRALSVRFLVAATKSPCGDQVASS